MTQIVDKVLKSFEGIYREEQVRVCSAKRVKSEFLETRIVLENCLGKKSLYRIFKTKKALVVYAHGFNKDGAFKDGRDCFQIQGTQIFSDKSAVYDDAFFRCAQHCIYHT